MNIGIVNLQYTNNYGAVIAAYILQEYISETIPQANVYIIDYRPAIPVDGYFSRKIYHAKINNGFFDLLRKKYYFDKRKNELKLRNEVFEKFRSTFLNRTQTITSLNDKSVAEISNFDAIVVGSDVVWQPKRLIYSDELLLSKIASCKKLAFAPSIDCDLKQIHPNILEKYKINLPSFELLSVREKENADELSQLLERNVNNICDPVFLKNKDFYMQLGDKSTAQKELQHYLYYYSLSSKKSYEKFGKKIACQYGLTYYSYIPDKDNKFADYNCTQDGPLEFLYRVTNSNILITNSYHCVCYALIFEKIFILLPRDKSSNKTKGLLDLFGIPYNYFTEIDPTEYNCNIKIKELKKEVDLFMIKLASLG